MLLGTLVGLVLWGTLQFRARDQVEVSLVAGPERRVGGTSELEGEAASNVGRISSSDPSKSSELEDGEEEWTRAKVLAYVTDKLRTSCTSVNEQEFADSHGGQVLREKRKLPKDLTAADRDELLALIDEVTRANRVTAARAAKQLGIELEAKWDRGDYTMTERGRTIHETMPAADAEESRSVQFRRTGSTGPFTAVLSLRSDESPILMAALAQIEQENDRFYRRRSEIVGE